MNELIMNTDLLGTLLALMPLGRGRLSFFGLLFTLLLILVVVTLLMRIGGVVRRQGRAPKIIFLLGIIAFGAYYYHMKEMEHRRVWTQIAAGSQSPLELVEGEKLVLTLRRSEKLPNAITGVDLALSLKQLAHNVALASQNDSDRDQLRWHELTVLRNDDGTIELGDVVTLRRITRRHQGPDREDVIELRTDDPSTLALFAETAVALQERIDQNSDPTLRLEIDDQRLIIHVVHGEDVVLPEIAAAADPIELDAIEVESPSSDEPVTETTDTEAEVSSPEENSTDEGEGIVSSAIRSLFEGLAEAKRERARHKSTSEVVTDSTEKKSAAEVATDEVLNSTTELTSDSGESQAPADDPSGEAVEVAATSIPAVVVSTPVSPAATEPTHEFAPPGLTDQGDYRMTIHAGPHSNLNDCEAELAEKRVAALADYAEKLLGADASEQIDFERFLFQHKVPERRRTEEFEHPEFGPMLNLYAELTFDRRIQQELRREYHDAVIGQRLAFTGVASGMVLFMLSAVFGFLKLDTASRGYYRGRLLAGAVGVVLLAFAFVVVFRYLTVGI